MVERVDGHLHVPLRPAGPRLPRAGNGALTMWSVGSENSVLSLWSRDSVLSIGSSQSFASVASVWSFASAGSIGSAMSAASLFSYQSAGLRPLPPEQRLDPVQPGRPGGAWPAYRRPATARGWSPPACWSRRPRSCGTRGEGRARLLGDSSTVTVDDMTRAIFEPEHEAFRETRRHVPRQGGRAAPRAVGEGRHRRPRGLGEGRRPGPARAPAARGVRRRRHARLPLQRA